MFLSKEVKAHATSVCVFWERKASLSIHLSMADNKDFPFQMVTSFSNDDRLLLFEEDQSPSTEQHYNQDVKNPEPSEETMIRCRYEGHVGESLLSKSEFYVNRRVCKKCFRQSTKRQKVVKTPQEEYEPESLKKEISDLRIRIQSLEKIIASEGRENHKSAKKVQQIETEKI